MTEGLDQMINNEIIFVAVEVENNVFAIPINYILYIVDGKQSIPSDALPQESENIIGMVELNGQIVTIVQIPGTCGDTSIVDNLIVVLEYSGHNFGILAKKTTLITILANEICEAEFTDIKSFMYDGKAHLILDLSQFCNDLDK